MKGRGSSSSAYSKSNLDEFGQYINCQNKILVLEKNKEYGMYESDDETSVGTSKLFSQEKYLKEQLNNIEVRLDLKNLEIENRLSPNLSKIKNYHIGNSSDKTEAKNEPKLLNPFIKNVNIDSIINADNIFGSFKKDEKLLTQKRKQTFS